MDDFNRPREPIHLVEQLGNVRVVLDDYRSPEDSEPLTIRIIFKDKEEPVPQVSTTSRVQVIHADELAELESTRNGCEVGEDELMTFGESVTLLIVIGVLLYLVYALLWPERF